MPSFTSLRVHDLRAAVRWYVDGLGMHLLAEMGRRHDGEVALVHLRRWKYQDILLIPVDAPVTAGDAVTLSFAAQAQELDELAARATAAGGGKASGPVITPWGTHDLTTVDPEGNTLVFTAPPAVIPQAPPGDFTMTTYP